MADVEGEFGLAPGQERRVIDGRRASPSPFWCGTTSRNEETAVHPCMVTREPVSCPAQVPSVASMTYDEAASNLADDPPKADGSASGG